MELSNSLSVEHGVEGSNLIDVHFINFNNFGNLPHGVEGQEIIALFLCEVKERDDGGSLPVRWVLGEDEFDLFIVFSCEFEGSGVVVLCVFSMGDVAGKAIWLKIGQVFKALAQHHQ